jgi:hypothetical protein
MKILLQIFFIVLFLVGCRNKDPVVDDLNSVKKHFLETISKSEVEEGPFHMHYDLKTVFFSKDVISLFGEISVYEHLPHSWRRYEGKTYVKINGKFKPIVLSDLFSTASQQEFLRNLCVKNLKNNPISYLSKNDPLKVKLEFRDLNTFVIDDQFLIVVFQPYVVGGGEDGPFMVKVPFEQLKNHWNNNNVLFPVLQKVVRSRNFITKLEENSFNID